jgi:ribosomal protein S18 acetylase RimI-like enzyme
MASDTAITLRYSSSVDELSALEPMWNALQAHHSQIIPDLAGSAPKRDLSDAWRIRKGKYERWLSDPKTFFVLAERAARPVGYAFVTVGAGYASWGTGERLAELETLSVLPGERDRGVGESLLETVWRRLRERGVYDMAITTAVTNVDSHRFYERHGFKRAFVVYYARSTKKPDC